MTTRRDNADSGRSGMVLLEVLIALSIFAVVTLGLVVALHASFDAAENRNDAETAARGLENQLTVLLSGPLPPGDREVAANESGIAYQISVVPALMRDQKQQAVSGFWRATLTARWKSGGREEAREISQLVYRP